MKPPCTERSCTIRNRSSRKPQSSGGRAYFASAGNSNSGSAPPASKRALNSATAGARSGVNGRAFTWRACLRRALRRSRPSDPAWSSGPFLPGQIGAKNGIPTPSPGSGAGRSPTPRCARVRSSHRAKISSRPGYRRRFRPPVPRPARSRAGLGGCQAFDPVRPRRLYLEIECPKRALGLAPDHLKTVSGIKLAGRRILLRGQEPAFQPRLPSQTRLAGQMSQKRSLHAAPDHAAAQQEGVELTHVSAVARDRDTHQAIVAVAVLHADRQNVTTRLAGELVNLLLAVTPRRQIELVRLLRELRHPCQRGGVHWSDFHHLLERTKKILSRDTTGFEH